jgi:hypothetical protein
LKGLLRRKLSDRADTNTIVDESAEVSEAQKATLEQELRTAGGADDAELISAARQVLALADPAGRRAGEYQVTVSGGQGVVVGDDATVTMNSGDILTGVAGTGATAGHRRSAQARGRLRVHLDALHRGRCRPRPRLRRRGA